MSKNENEFLNFYVTFQKNVFAACFDGEFVLLDLNNDYYLGIDSRTSEILAKLLRVEILSRKRVDSSNAIDEKEVKTTFESLHSLGLISKRSNTQNYVSNIHFPAENGGLTVCEWRPDHSLLSDLRKKPSFWKVLEALIRILQADLVLVQGRLLGFVNYAEKIVTRRQPVPVRPDIESIAILHESVQRARIWYPRKVDCLLGSCALLLMMLKRGIRSNLVVGVQKYPFYAHAWVEYGNIVVNDEAEVQRRLAEILRIPI